MAAVQRISTICAFPVNASHSAMSCFTKEAWLSASYWNQYR